MGVGNINESKGRRLWKQIGDRVSMGQDEDGNPLWQPVVKRFARLPNPVTYDTKRGHEEFDPWMIQVQHENGDLEI